MAQLKIFVSHSHEDDSFCRELAAALRGADADVWYDEHNMQPGQLGPTIDRELAERPVFVVILSPVALASAWVEDETRWAYTLHRKDRMRILLPVVARVVGEEEMWLFLRDFKRIEAPGGKPYPLEETIERTVQSLGLTISRESAPDPPLAAVQQIDFPTTSCADSPCIYRRNSRMRSSNL